MSLNSSNNNNIDENILQNIAAISDKKSHDDILSAYNNKNDMYP